MESKNKELFIVGVPAALFAWWSFTSMPTPEDDVNNHPFIEIGVTPRFTLTENPDRLEYAQALFVALQKADLKAQYALLSKHAPFTLRSDRTYQDSARDRVFMKERWGQTLRYYTYYTLEGALSTQEGCWVPDGAVINTDYKEGQLMVHIDGGQRYDEHCPNTLVLMSGVDENMTAALHNVIYRIAEDVMYRGGIAYMGDSEAQLRSPGETHIKATGFERCVKRNALKQCVEHEQIGE